MRLTALKLSGLIHGLRFDNLRGDLFGGITAAVVALPLSLAFGVASGAGPVAGLYGAICVGFFAALFGGTPAQVSGPTGPMTVVMAAIFMQYTSLFPDDPGKGAVLAFTVVMLGGGFQILFGLLRLGKYINLVPAPVISGFMTGIGVIIILLQLAPLLGQPVAAGPLEASRALPQVFANVVPGAALLGGFTLLLVYLWPKRLNRILPAPLLALLAGSLGLYVVSGGVIVSREVDGRTLHFLGQASILGDIPGGLPSVVFPDIDLALAADMIKSALMLAVLGSIDSLLTSLVADNITRTYHESDRELVGQGIGNAVSGLFGGLPGAGATMRTVVNVRAGGLTPISGMTHAVGLLAVALGAGALARYVPHAVLAGILVKVGTDIIDWDYLKRMRLISIAGSAMMLTVFFLTVFVDLITAVAVGMIMASLVLMKRITDMQLASITAITEPHEEAPLSPEERELLAAAGGRVLLYHMGGPMSFGAAKDMVRRLAAFDQYDALVLDLSDVPSIDYTTTRSIEDMIQRAQGSGRAVFLTGEPPQVMDMLEKHGVLAQLAEGGHLPTRREGLAAAVRGLAPVRQQT
ncbi:MAG: SulP family inorganic anion transporter [Betaproteobacteria bacterium]|nr:SulP family inorganic anion transporter [Betaproteobacteria bacterium]